MVDAHDYVDVYRIYHVPSRRFLSSRGCVTRTIIGRFFTLGGLRSKASQDPHMIAYPNDYLVYRYIFWGNGRVDNDGVRTLAEVISK